MSTIDRLKCPACGMPTIPDDGHNTPDMALCNFCYEQEDLETMSTHTHQDRGKQGQGNLPTKYLSGTPKARTGATGSFVKLGGTRPTPD